MPDRFSSSEFTSICDRLAITDPDLRSIMDRFGYPPMWTRPNSFETLVHIILEQQVSLASAKAALEKLRDKIGSISPEALLLLTDEELKACFFSRQKSAYARNLAEAIISRSFSLDKLEKMGSDDVRSAMIQLKGIGNWTIDVYLMFTLQRADIFPIGDLAAVNALKEIKKLPKETSRDELLKIADEWRPYRTVATMILWHHYLSKRKTLAI